MRVDGEGEEAYFGSSLLMTSGHSSHRSGLTMLVRACVASVHIGR